MRSCLVVYGTILLYSRLMSCGCLTKALPQTSNLAPRFAMNTSVTIRLRGLAMPEENAKTSAVPALHAVLGAGVPDEVLLANICEGDMQSLGHMFQRYARLVRGIALRILRDRAEADDLLQEVFLFIHRRCQVFDATKCSARSWIVQMTYQRAIDRRRYLQSRHFYTRVDLDGGTELVDPRS